MSDKLSKDQRSYNMSRIRGKNTSPERALKKYLKTKKNGKKFIEKRAAFRSFENINVTSKY